MKFSQAPILEIAHPDSTPTSFLSERHDECAEQVARRVKHAIFFFGIVESITAVTAKIKRVVRVSMRTEETASVSDSGQLSSMEVRRRFRMRTRLGQSGRSVFAELSGCFYDIANITPLEKI